MKGDNMDYTTLTDEEFEQHREALMAELNRRNQLKEAPIQVAQIAEQYEELGGDVEELAQCVLSHDEVIHQDVIQELES